MVRPEPFEDQIREEERVGRELLVYYRIRRRSVEAVLRVQGQIGGPQARLEHQDGHGDKPCMLFYRIFE